jgi:hypothetical protein
VRASAEIAVTSDDTATDLRAARWEFNFLRGEVIGDSFNNDA